MGRLGEIAPRTLAVRLWWSVVVVTVEAENGVIGGPGSMCQARSVPPVAAQTPSDMLPISRQDGDECLSTPSTSTVDMAMRRLRPDSPRQDLML